MIQVAVVDLSGTPVATSITSAINGFKCFVPVDVPDSSEAGIRTAIHRDEIHMGVLLPADLGQGALQRAEAGPSGPSAGATSRSAERSGDDSGAAWLGYDVYGHPDDRSGCDAVAMITLASLRFRKRLG